MKTSNPFSISQRLLSFKHAFAGLRTLFSEEHNARIHLVSAIIALILGFVLRISLSEWVLLVIVIGIVFICELINTSLEALADFVSPEKHPQIKKVKDLAAAAVLISAVSALVTGIIIFLPKIITLCTNN
ncbi:diacylglycerol kinase family protein [Fluviicola chungangensis]|uniref:Diacylglycerol kinase family protein n=1 Tax=Fluviicola chungangensis TaxID=2597671 RepID=A0A556MR66_9FLAO|nr:diacylglycerol kinase family protein [Fluviicola chungangensis]TSJ42407.1 diacylglycerol kinase family protein [Fluviicola chungangensis]